MENDTNKLINPSFRKEPTENIQNLRLALEEVNRWYRHIDTFLWALSSFLLIGTGFAISQAIEMNGENWKIIILGSVMLLVWYWYRKFLKDILLKVQYFMKITNKLEKELGINVLPEGKDDFVKELDSDIFPSSIINSLENVKAKYFSALMIYMIYLAWIIWLFFIFEFVAENWCEIMAKIWQFFC